MSITQQLVAAEAKYLNRFYSACKEIFGGSHMPSHDHTHHLRVWQYCKRLLQQANNYGHLFSEDFIEALLAAAMLHDIGLSKITDERHGPEGAEMFKRYISHNPDIQLSLYDEALEAIRVHDLKSPSSLNKAFDLASFLTICDNLDSFGYIGAYRYAEIYLIRGMKVSEIAIRSLENIEKRFGGFQLHYARLPEFFEEQKQRYTQACSVFNNEQAMAEITEAIARLSIKEKKSIPEIAEVYAGKSNHSFWHQLKQELSTFNVMG